MIDLEFLENIDGELKMMNKRKRGKPYRYGESLFKFVGYPYAFVRNYRILEGIAENCFNSFFPVVLGDLLTLLGLFHACSPCAFGKL